MIEIEQRTGDFMAYVAGNRAIWECAPTASEASLRLQLRLKTEELNAESALSLLLLNALQAVLESVTLRIDDPRIVHFDAARAAVAQATGGGE